jgi:sugar phosphate isomerase/epimerase
LIQAADGGLSRREVVDALAGLCERARAHELIVTLEFMPWSPIGSLSDALAVVEAADQPNCGVNVDTWHHFRTGGTLADIARLEPSRVGAVQLNDVAAEPWEDLLAETAQNRQLPGQGVSDSGAVLEAFWNAGVRVPLNLEVFSARLQALAPREAARELAESMRALLPED